MNNSIYHIIITHFNITWKMPKKNGRYKIFENPPDKEWMKHRIKLFKKYCYPSVVGQTDQQFDWFVYFDEERTDRDYFSKFDRITPIYISYDTPFDVKRHFVRKLIKLGNRARRIITTNLDNDDALNVDYIKKIHNEMNLEKRIELLEFPLGLLYDHIDGKFLRHYDESGPFMSLGEDTVVGARAQLKTIRNRDHRQMKKTLRLAYRSIKTSVPMWLQVVHQNNHKNLMDRGDSINMTKSKIKKHFNVDL